MSDLYSNKEIREIAERLVRNEVIYCISALMYAINHSQEAQTGLEISFEDLQAVNESIDFEQAAWDHIDGMDRDDLLQYLEDRDCMDAGDDVPDDELRAKAKREASAQGFNEFCDDHDVDISRYTSEVYEHWIVSDWLAGRLAEKGEAVSKDLIGLTVWGRTTTGQSISMDSVILSIAKDMHDEK